ncbi:MAG: hypothetical protein K2N38_10435 [Oscillospiraceae bacterium]|nr:hypothetical protein [Oscillospiraceae bacterium]
MDFREEYKSEMNSAMPDEQAMERIRQGVAEKLAAPKRKPFPVRRVAAICGSAAACLVIGFTAIMLTAGNRFITSGGMNMAPSALRPSTESLAGGADMGTQNICTPNMDGSYLGDQNGGDADMNNAPAEDPTKPAGAVNDEPPSENRDENRGDDADSAPQYSDGKSNSDNSGSLEHQQPENFWGCSTTVSFSEGMITLTINGTVRRFEAISTSGGGGGSEDSYYEMPSADETNIMPANPEDNGTPTAPEVNGGDELIEVTADSGELLFVKTDGGKLWLYDAELELLGMFVEIE